MSLPASSLVETPIAATRGRARRPRGAGWLPHAIRAGLAGVATGAGTYTVFSSGILPQAASVGLLFLLLALVPVAPKLCHRVVLNAALLVGWAPVLWWVDWPISVNHGAAVVSAVIGSLVGYVAAATEPRRRFASLVPEFQLSDALMAGAPMVALLATQTLAFTSSPLRALAVLVPGADNYAHFNMFSTLRAYGVTTDAIGASPDGSGWAFSNYPKGFHAIVATISEITSPKMETGPDSLVVYAHTLAVVVALGLVMVTGAILALPRLGERPALAVPAVVLTWTALLWEPGQKVLANGFASFWLGAVAAGCALLVSVTAPRTPVAVQVAAVGGLLVCVAHTWTPLVIVAAPAALAVMVSGDNDADGSHRRPRRGISFAVLGVSALAALKAVVILMGTVPVDFIVSEVSGFDGSSPFPTLVLVLVLLYTLLSYRTWVTGRTGIPLSLSSARRLACLTLAPMLGLVSLTALLVMQVQAIGTTSYYFLKYLLGFELILACVTPAILGMLLATVTERSTRPRLTPALSVVATLLATQFFGHLPFRDALLFSETDDGTAAISAPYSRLGIAQGVLRALEHATPNESFDREYLPLGRGNAVQMFYPDGWYHAVNASLTNRVNARLTVLRVNADTVEQAAPLVQRLLVKEPELVIAVDPAFVAPLRVRIGGSTMAHRVVSLAEE